ncbi:MAG: ABC transporter permease subunit, partial [Candidatus Thermoplasmatota archaeon]
AEHGRRGPVGASFRVLLDAMAATPSIVVGLFVFTVLVLTQGHYSALAGALALAIMIVPVVARTTEVSLLAVPDSIREASVALGATHGRTLFRVTLPAARAGTVTGAIIAAARVAGETAPLIFTSPLVVNYFQGLDKPVASIPMTIFLDISQPDALHQAQAWGAALVLFVLVFGANVLVRVLTHARRSAS